MGRFYTVLEIQQDANGNRAAIPTIYSDEDRALAKYYTVCAAAAVSVIPYHAAVILRDDGVVTNGQVFDRRVEPETAGNAGE